jgi:ABC-type glutathione transport system ATPase component
MPVRPADLIANIGKLVDDVPNIYREQQQAAIHYEQETKKSQKLSKEEDEKILKVENVEKAEKIKRRMHEAENMHKIDIKV